MHIKVFLFNFVLLIHLKNNNIGNLFQDQFHELEKKQFVKIIDNEIIIREKSKLLINFLSIESNYSNYKEKKIIKKSNRVINEGFDEFIVIRDEGIVFVKFNGEIKKFIGIIQLSQKEIITLV